jgi:hypothetical protein
MRTDDLHGKALFRARAGLPCATLFAVRAHYAVRIALCRAATSLPCASTLPCGQSMP